MLDKLDDSEHEKQHSGTTRKTLFSQLFLQFAIQKHTVESRLSGIFLKSTLEN